MGEGEPTQAAVPSAKPGAASRLEHGARVGRFEIVRLLGEGGMGAVYEARDPDLGRRVAIKLIRDPDAHQSMRLVREAQALAQLQHPNVVAVYDVGEHDDEVFVAMELVDGVSLDKLDPKPTSWREIVALFAQAGRGLAIAHDKGLVHRDVKPSNILVDRAGRVRVGDFGLARLAPAADAPARDDVTTAPGRARPPSDVSPIASTIEETGERTTGPAPVTPSGQGFLGTPLTHAGAYLGTPRYMAPEQHACRPATEKSDQFGFCVALWETIFGEHPFDDVPGGIAAAVTENRRRRRPADRAAPRWLVNALDRGLSLAPGDRHPSMAALVDLLERTPIRRRRAFLAAALVTVVVALGAGAAFALLRRDSRAGSAVSCDAAGDDFATVWTDAVRAKMTEAFTGARPYGADAATRTGARIDAYGARWKAARVDACRAHRRGEQSDELLDRRMGCLDRELGEVRAVVGTLGAADGAVVDRAVDLVARLPSPERCGTQLATVMPDPDDPRAEEIRNDLRKMRELFDRQDAPAARALAVDVRARADALGHPGLRARVLVNVAKVIEGTDPTAVDATLDQALADAVRAGDRDTETEVLAYRLRRAIRSEDVKAVETLLPVLSASAARDGVTRTVRENVAVFESEAYRVLARVDDALAACDRIAAVEDPPQASAKDCRCRQLVQAVRIEAAALACAEAVAAFEEQYGPMHQRTAPAIGNLAALERQRGRHEESLKLNLRAISIYEAAYGPDSARVTNPLYSAAGAYVTLERFDEARAAIERSLSILRKIEKGPSRKLASQIAMLGQILVAQGKTDEGVRHADEALRMNEEVVGAEHAFNVEMLAFHAEINGHATRWSVTEGSYRRCAAIAAKTFGEKHMLHGACLAGQARALLELGRGKDALPLARRAVEVLSSTETDPYQLGAARLAHGRALAMTGDRARAATEIQAAIDIFRPIGKTAENELATAEAALLELR